MADTTPPRGTLSGAPTLPSSSINRYGLTDAGAHFADIDGDGDLDALMGKSDGNTLVQLNTGSASQPAFAAATLNPYGLKDVGANAQPWLADIDGDGDLDAFIGSKDRGIVVQLNTGSATRPAFAAATSNPYGLADKSKLVKPGFMDMDGDGDLDALVVNRDGKSMVQLNTGSASKPAFAAATPSAYDFAGYSYADIDADGDLDAFIG
ncbi:MAG: FG-GAP repeat domain-containing protein, partial [Aeromonas sp.]